MISQQELDCLEAMKVGGSFTFGLSRAYLHGDARNRAKLRGTFADVFTRYGLPSKGRGEAATLEEMFVALKNWETSGVPAVYGYEATGAANFVRWYYAQPEGGACHE